MNKRGVALFIVISTIMFIVLLSNAIISIISSQTRQTFHQVSRIQAYYAALAGMNFALDQLRTGAWQYDALASINNCPDPGGCNIPADTNFPVSIVGQTVTVIFCDPNQVCQGTSNACAPPPGNDFCINVTANYTPP